MPEGEFGQVRAKKQRKLQQFATEKIKNEKSQFEDLSKVVICNEIATKNPTNSTPYRRRFNETITR